jgi:hypothetical protein
VSICTHCHTHKEQNEYYKNNKNLSGYSHICKICDNKRRAQYYRDNYKHQGKQAKVRKQKLKEQCIALKGGACVVCGLVDDPCVFDFHHIDPSKKLFEIGRFIHDLEGTKAELDKCILVCSNCHRKIHWGK